MSSLGDQYLLDELSEHLQYLLSSHANVCKGWVVEKGRLKTNDGLCEKAASRTEIRRCRDVVDEFYAWSDMMVA